MFDFVERIYGIAQLVPFLKLSSLSLYQAFAICVTCLDGKIADRKGYEYMRKMIGGEGTAASTASGSGSGSGAAAGANGESRRGSISSMLGIGGNSSSSAGGDAKNVLVSVSGLGSCHHVMSIILYCLHLVLCL